MLIDWFTVTAQLINFLILVWLLKRFLYQPILAAIDAREQRIANELEDANKRQIEATSERDRFQQNNIDFAQNKQAMLQKVTAAVEQERQRLLTAARVQADDLSSKHQASLNRQEQNIHTEIRRLVCAEVFAIARKALQDLAGVSLESAMAELFLQRLNGLDETTRKTFIHSLACTRKSGVPIEQLLVYSTFGLTAEQQASIQGAVNTIFADDIPLQFSTGTKLICGIELSFGGHKIAWSIAEYFRALEIKISTLLVPVSASSEDIATSDTPDSISVLPINPTNAEAVS